MTHTRIPPGHPGIRPRWTSSAKSGVGTAVSDACRVWFTVSHGILNEIYHPFVDKANTRDMEFLVADGQDFFSEEKRDTSHRICPIKQGVPGYQITNTCTQGRYRIHKTILADPKRDVLLQQVHFEPLRGKLADYGMYALLAPHINNAGAGNDGWIGAYKDTPALFAQHGNVVLAMACSAPFKALSCGYVGYSDGWQDVSRHKLMTWRYPEARNGNIALTAQIDLEACGGKFVLVIGFGESEAETGEQARAALLRSFAHIQQSYIREWDQFQANCIPLEAPPRDGFDLYRVSTAVLKTHDGKRFPGGVIASLSIPWGFARGDGEQGGYHLVWPRDQVEAAGAQLACGNAEDARSTLFYLMCTQEADGHWSQNMWLDGSPHWTGIQLDETGFFCLLADAIKRRGQLADIDPWPAIRKAVQFLVHYGPVTQEDRWEESSGYSVFTLAVLIAALLCAADFADAAGEVQVARYLRETADNWNENIECWTYATATELAQKAGVEGYYVRIAPAEILHTRSLKDTTIHLKNLPPGQNSFPASDIVSCDALALVRFGLRAWNDSRILNTVKVIDMTLKTETKTGPVWHRYNHDGYGEHADGSPFDGTGIGRGWPLLAGERAHYEIAAGNFQAAIQLCHVMAAQTSPGGMIPEQVWDAPDIPERELFNGYPAGSGMPLVWAHSEYLKLLRSLHDQMVWDMPPQTVQRYQQERRASPYVFWRFQYQQPHLQQGKNLRIELQAPAVVHWTADNWRTCKETRTQDTGLGMYIVDLPTGRLKAGAKVVFTFYWINSQNWEGRDFEVEVLGSALRRSRQ